MPTDIRYEFSLPTGHEFEKLLRPLMDDPRAMASVDTEEQLDRIEYKLDKLIQLLSSSTSTLEAE